MTVDNGGTFAVQLSNIHEADFDSGAGTDTTPAMGIAVPASGGAAIIPGDATAGLKVDLGADNDVVVTGTVDLGATDNAVLDSIDTAVNGTLTVDLATNNDVQGAAAEGAAVSGNPFLIAGDDGTNVKHVAVAADGAVHVDDGGNSLTVDNNGTFAVQISDTSFAVADGNALGEGVLIQGDDGTDRKNINVDATTGDVQVDVTNTVTVDSGTFTLSANSGVDIGDVDVLSIAAGSNLIGDVGLSGARTSGGTTLYKNIDVDESEDEIKGTAGQVYWIHAVNLSASTLFLKLYDNTAATVVVGTTVPDLTLPIPTQGNTDGAGFTLAIPNGIAFGTAITIACTTGVADNDSGAPGANACVVNLGYA